MVYGGIGHCLTVWQADILAQHSHSEALQEVYYLNFQEGLQLVLADWQEQ